MAEASGKRVYDYLYRSGLRMYIENLVGVVGHSYGLRVSWSENYQSLPILIVLSR